MRPQSFLWKLTKWIAFVSVFMYAWLSGLASMGESSVTGRTVQVTNRGDQFFYPDAAGEAAVNFGSAWFTIGCCMLIAFVVLFLVSLALWLRRCHKWNHYEEYADQVMRENQQLRATARAAGPGFQGRPVTEATQIVGCPQHDETEVPTTDSQYRVSKLQHDLTTQSDDLDSDIVSLTPSQIKQLQAELAVPEVRPCTFDVTIPGWLERIGHWGKISIEHRDEKGKRVVSKDRFIELISDPDLNRMLGLWNIEKVNQMTCQFARTFPGVDGKIHKEEFTIRVEPRKELR